jgi:hypothetical protein
MMTLSFNPNQCICYPESTKDFLLQVHAISDIPQDNSYQPILEDASEISKN